jgi:hypothetical protein
VPTVEVSNRVSKLGVGSTLPWVLAVRLIVKAVRFVAAVISAAVGTSAADARPPDVANAM